MIRDEIWNRGLPQLYHYAISKCLKFLNVSVHKTDQKQTDWHAIGKVS